MELLVPLHVLRTVCQVVFLPGPPASACTTTHTHVVHTHLAVGRVATIIRPTCRLSKLLRLGPIGRDHSAVNSKYGPESKIWPGKQHQKPKQEHPDSEHGCSLALPALSSSHHVILVPKGEGSPHCHAWGWPVSVAVSAGDGDLRVRLHVYTHLVVGRGATNVLPSDRLSC